MDINYWIEFSKLLSGGLAGSIVTYILTSRKNRKQKIEYHNWLSMVTRELPLSKTYIFEQSIVNKETNEKYPVLNLHEAFIEIENIGNVDYKIFSFNIEFPPKLKAISIQEIKSSASFESSFHPIPSLESPEGILKIVTDPFNRGDIRQFRVLAQSIDEIPFELRINAGKKIKLTSKEPVIFQDRFEARRKSFWKGSRYVRVRPGVLLILLIIYVLIYLFLIKLKIVN